MKVSELWNDVYLKHVDKKKRWSTGVTYRAIWNRHLANHLGDCNIQAYTAVDATRFLTGLADDYGKHTVAHIRALMSGLFGYAAALGYISVNPIRDAKVLSEGREPEETVAYTRTQIEQMIGALDGDPLAQLALGLGGLAALRPSEVAGIQWLDVEPAQVQIRRAVVAGVVDKTKTKHSAAPVPLIPRVQVLFSNVPRTGKWVFRREDADLPVHMDEWTRRRIAKPLKAQGIAWRGLYGGRRGAGTKIAEATSPLVAAALLRNDPATTLKHYVKSNRMALAQQAAAALEK